MPMMGNPGVPSSQAVAISAIVDILELLKAADQTLPAAVADLRAAEAEAKAALEELDKRTAELVVAQDALGEKAADLEARHVKLAQDEADAQAAALANADRAATMEAQGRAMEAKQAELDAALAGIDDLYQAAQREIARQKSEASQEIDAGRDQLGRERDECAAIIMAAHEESHSEIVKLRTAAEIECAALRDRAQRLMDAALTKEAAVRKHAAELAALVGE